MTSINERIIIVAEVDSRCESLLKLSQELCSYSSKHLSLYVSAAAAAPKVTVRQTCGSQVHPARQTGANAADRATYLYVIHIRK